MSLDTPYALGSCSLPWSDKGRHFLGNGSSTGGQLWLQLPSNQPSLLALGQGMATSPASAAAAALAAGTGPGGVPSMNPPMPSYEALLPPHSHLAMGDQLAAASSTAGPPGSFASPAGAGLPAAVAGTAPGGLQAGVGLTPDAWQSMLALQMFQTATAVAAAAIAAAASGRPASITAAINGRQGAGPNMPLPRQYWLNLPGMLQHVQAELAAAQKPFPGRGLAGGELAAGQGEGERMPLPEAQELGCGPHPGDGRDLMAKVSIKACRGLPHPLLH